MQGRLRVPARKMQKFRRCGAPARSLICSRRYFVRVRCPPTFTAIPRYNRSQRKNGLSGYELPFPLRLRHGLYFRRGYPALSAGEPSPSTCVLLTRSMGNPRGFSSPFLRSTAQYVLIRKSRVSNSGCGRDQHYSCKPRPLSETKSDEPFHNTQLDHL